MAKKVTRKQLLKEPDEFITFSGKLIRWATAHRKQILISFAVIIAAGLIWGLLSFFHNRAENQAFALLQKLDEKYQNSLQKDNDPKIALQEVEEEFEALIGEYSGYNGGKIARLQFANYCYDGGEYDKAIGLFEKALADFGGNPSYENFILSGLAYSFDAKKDYQSSAQYFEMIAESSTQILKDEALFNLGRLYTALGNEEKSAEVYENLISDYPDSIYIDMVRDRVKS